MANLLLIESPGKLKKLSQILGPGWTVKASMGHIRELANEGEDALGFELKENKITCKYIPRDTRAKKTIAALRQAAKQADKVYIATDPDREGETIGWHLQQALRLKSPQRVVYSEITPAAVKKAIAHPRKLDQSLVAAGRARDCLDKLVGYKGSRHVVWPLNNGAKSMGRVQSATLHLLCQRERDIRAFTPQDYWSVWVTYAEGFKAFYRKHPNPKKASPKRAAAASGAGATQDAVDEAGGKKNKPESERITTQAEADRLLTIVRTQPHKTLSVEGKVKHQSPPPPFITSSLQQAAGSKLRFKPEQTMKVAQSLYEAGHITYMRTDSVELAAPFKAAVKDYLTQHDPTNIPARAKKYRAAKGAQAAHEAIRPTHVTMTPQQLSPQVSAAAAKLYELIWNRAVASQCCAARLRKTRIVTQAGETFWEARGQVVEFAGYTRYWNNLSADSQLPTVQPAQALKLTQADAEKKQTQPPPRYSEPKLVQLMERKGIGRPSTYAPTIKTLRSRNYVQSLQAKSSKAKSNSGKLQPTDLGLALDGALEQLLPDLIQPEFTAQMEASLDAIAAGQQEWQAYLTSWHQAYFGPALAQAQVKLPSVMMAALRQSAVSHGSSLGPSSGPSSGANAGVSSQGHKQSGSSQAAMIGDMAADRDRPSSNRQQRKRASSGSDQQASLACPKCAQAMNKIPSRSKKLKTDHFLRCSAATCDAVMFWNPKKKTYEQPYNQRPIDPSAFTDHPCPSCGALLVRHPYQKDGQDKVMLRCSIFENRKGKCKDVAYFMGRDGFWSPTFGNLATPPKENSNTGAAPKQPAGSKSKTKAKPKASAKANANATRKTRKKAGTTTKAQAKTKTSAKTQPKPKATPTTRKPKTRSKTDANKNRP